MVNKTIGVVVTLFALLFSPTSSQAITFGEEVLSGGTEHPYIISIWYTTTPERAPEFICSGTLIEPTVVLTAAHCVKDTGAYYVKYGNNLLKEGSLREVTATWKSPQYSQSQSVGDVGLMRLSYPALGIQTIPLANTVAIKKILTNKKTRLEALGWGIDQNGNNATYLRKVSAKDESSAMKTRFKNNWRSDVWLAAGKYDSKQKVYAGVCSGDSGGPLFAVNGSQRIQVGVTSFGFSEDCEVRAPSVFMRLSYYVGHIQQNLRTLENNQVVQNRAFPSIIEEPKIVGSAAAGSTITCNQGRWSDNTTSVSVSWTTSTGTYNAASLTLSETSYSRTIQCTVIGKNTNGELKRVLTIVQPPTPVKPSTPYPSISGISSYSNTTVGTVAQCSATSYSSDATMSYQWGYGTSWSVSSLTNPIGSGSTLTITQSILDMVKGKYLICMATATNSAGSSSGFTTQSVTGASVSPTPTPTPSPSSSSTAKPDNPSTTVTSVHGTTSSGTSRTIYSPAIGDTFTCNYRTLRTGESASINWYYGFWSYSNSGSAFSPSRLISSSGSITLSNALLTQIGFRNTSTSYLMCEVSISNSSGLTYSYSGVDFYTTPTPSPTPSATPAPLPTFSAPTISSVTSTNVVVVQPAKPSNWLSSYQIVAEVYSSNEQTKIGAASEGVYYNPGSTMTISANNAGGISGGNTYKVRFAVWDSSSNRYTYGPFTSFSTPTPTPTPTVQLCEQTGWVNCGSVSPASGNAAWTLVADFRASGANSITSVQSRILMPDGSVVSTVNAALKSGSVNDGTWTATFSPIRGIYSNGTGFKIEANAMNNLGGQSGWTLVTVYFINNSSTVNQNPR
jgi:secreted trypsin-like serine protease